jgi:lysophospholipase L1-like esterase
MHKTKDVAGGLALLIGAVLVTLLILELGVRLAHGTQWLVHWPNLVLQFRLGNADALGMAYDPRLGFVPRPGHTAGVISYDAHGFRSSPAPSTATLAEPPILAVGDSFTHGDELRDGETWPAQLQGLIGRRVVNGGVRAYGIDQMVLRAESAAADVKPAAIALVFIPDDVRRNEMRRMWGAEKPYFKLVDGTLVLRNVPVPPSPPPAETLSLWQRLFGRSLLVNFVLMRLRWQYEWMLDHERVLTAQEGERLLCPLMRRLADIGVPTLVVAVYDPYVWEDPGYAPVLRRTSAQVLACASAAGLATLDLFDTIDAAAKQQGLAPLFRVAHPSPQGAHLMAREIANELEKWKLATH